MDSGAYAGGMLIGFVIGLLFGLVFAVLIGGLFLKLAVRIIEKFPLGYGRACLVTLVSALVSFAVNFAISFVFAFAFGAASSGPDSYGAAAAGMLLSFAVGIVLGFFINAGVIHLMVKRPGGGDLGFGRACLISLLQMAFGLVLYGLLAVVLMGLAVLIPAIAMPH